MLAKCFHRFRHSSDIIIFASGTILSKPSALILFLCWTDRPSVIIPISRVSFGFAAGGSEFTGNKDSKLPFEIFLVQSNELFIAEEGSKATDPNGLRFSWTSKFIGLEENGLLLPEIDPTNI